MSASLWIVESETKYRGTSRGVLGVARSVDVAKSAVADRHHRDHKHDQFCRLCNTNWERHGQQWWKRFSDDDVSYWYTITPAKFLGGK